MTDKPTPAQIEAARNKIALLRTQDVSAKDIAKAALTAAAEVAEVADEDREHRIRVLGSEIAMLRNKLAEVGKDAAEVGEPPLTKFKGVLPEDTRRLWRAINGYDIDDFDKRAEAFTHSMLDGLQVGPSNRASVKSALAENFEQLALDRIAATIERCAQKLDAMARTWKMDVVKTALEEAAAAIRALKND